MAERSTTVHGRTVRYADAGGGDGPPIVLEAGLGHSGRAWGPLQGLLAEHARVIAYDRAGYGGSAPSAAPRTAAACAGELAALLESIPVPTPCLFVGHSFGGLVVRALADRRPDLVAGLVLLDATHEDLPLARGRLVSAAMATTQLLLTTAVRTGLLRRRLEAGRGPTARLIRTFPAEQQQGLVDDACRVAAVRAGGAELRALGTSLDHARSARWPAVPVLAVTGGRGSGPREAAMRATVGRCWEAAMTRLPDGRHVVVPEAGHLLAQESPVAVAALITEHHRRVTSTSATRGLPA